MKEFVPHALWLYTNGRQACGCRYSGSEKFQSIISNLLSNGLHSRNSSNLVVIYAISTPNITANSILSRCIGVPPNSDIARALEHQTPRKCRQMSKHALIMYPIQASYGESSYIYSSLSYFSNRYANRAARFISAYAHGLSGAELVWIKKKYSSHRILPPSMMEEVKKSMNRA